LFFFVIGREDQCADSFAEQMYFFSLKRRLAANTGLPNASIYLLRWPGLDPGTAETQTHLIDEYFADLERQVRDFLKVSHSDLPKSILRKLTKNKTALFFWSSINLSEWSSGHLSLAARWIDWWQRLGEQKTGRPVILLLCIQYERSLWARLRCAVRRPWAQRTLDGFVRSRTDASVARLPELSNIGFDDVAYWIREHVKDYDREVLLRDIRRRFRSSFWRRNRIPMERSAELIRVALRNPEAKPIEQP
jgi:hypothetical protein